MMEADIHKAESFIYLFVFSQLNGLTLSEEAMHKLKLKYIDDKERELNQKILSQQSILRNSELAV
jgi:hypothetical protein